MKKIKSLALLALLAVSPPLLAAGQGGFPSRPNFQDVRIINGTVCSVGTAGTNAIAKAYYISLCYETAAIDGITSFMESAGWNISGQRNTNMHIRLGTNAVATTYPTIKMSISRNNFNVDPPTETDIWVWRYTTGDAASNFALEATDAVLGDGTSDALRINRTTGAVFVNAAFYSGKACAAGYTRIGPNYCEANAHAVTALAVGACTTVARPASDTKAFLVYSLNYAQAANAVLARFSRTEYFTSNTCATVYKAGATASNHEGAALAGGTILASDAINTIVKPDAGGNLYIKTTVDAGGNGTAFYQIVGYYD